MRWCFYFLFVFLFVGCARENGTSKNVKVGLTNLSRVEKRIVVLEDSLHVYYEKLMNNSADTLPFYTIHLLASNYKRAFQLGVKNEHSAIYLDKLQQLYLQEKKYALSLSWTDTLLTRFPLYKEKAALLLNAATTAEVYLKDEKKMRYYYERLLLEHPKLKQEIVAMVQLRLKNF